MESFEKNKERIEEIIKCSKDEDVTTEELLDLLDESINIGTEICEKSNSEIQASFNSRSDDNRDNTDEGFQS